MTDAERLLWQAIRSKQFYAHRFRRQHPIGSYIADFACIEQKLVIELDGANIRISLCKMVEELIICRRLAGMFCAFGITRS